RLHPEDRNFHIIEGLNLTPVRLLKLTDERIDTLVTERVIQTTQGDIIESARDELAMMQQPALTLFHVQVMERLHVDIAFGVDIIEHNSFNNLVPFLKAELKKSFMPKAPRAASIAAAAAIAKHDGGSNPDNSSHERSNRKDAPIKEEICEVNKLIIFQQRQSGAGYCLRNHICKYIMRAKGNLSESTLSKELIELFSLYGAIEDAYLRVRYGPEYETIEDTRQKLQDRRNVVAIKTREHDENKDKDAKLTTLNTTTTFPSAHSTTESISSSSLPPTNIYPQKYDHTNYTYSDYYYSYPYSMYYSQYNQEPSIPGVDYQHGQYNQEPPIPGVDYQYSQYNQEPPIPGVGYQYSQYSQEPPIPGVDYQYSQYSQEPPIPGVQPEKNTSNIQSEKTTERTSVSEPKKRRRI
ncbi:11842_t:CDS:2, partial [Racocetra fulgida]